MKALTVKQPWAWQIIHSTKDVENRSWRTNYRGPLYIHTALKDDREAMRLLPGHDPSGKPRFFLFGQVIGTVDVIDCHHADDCGKPVGFAEHLDSQQFALCSSWAMEDQYHWVLANPRPLATPFPMKGKLGIWNFGEVSL